MGEKDPAKSSVAKRITVLVLTLGLVALGIHMWLAGVGDQKTASALIMGIVLGTIYTVRGGSLPSIVYRASQSHWAHGSGITTDDDPSNLSPKLYLPILAVVILTATILFLYYTRRR